MREIESLLRDGVDTAFELQTHEPLSGAADAKRRVLHRGRRRRVTRIGTSVGLSLALVVGAASAGSTLLQADREVGGPVVPEVGAEYAFQGDALATDGRSLWIGSSKSSNTAGDENSVGRMDLATGEIVHGDPSIQMPHSMAWGESGVWSVAWQGDMPVGGEGAPVRGVIQRVDPETLERTGTIAREDSAPYDLAVGEVAGHETVWVVDAGRDELLQIDARTMVIETIHQTPANPVSVEVYESYVYVSSSKDHVVTRLDVTTGMTVEFPVPDCANDVEIAAGSLWVTDYCGNAVHRIDEGSGEIVSLDVGKSPSAIEHAEGLVWVVTRDGVARVDPETNEPVGNVVYVTEFFNGDLLYARGIMWAFGFEGVYRLDEDVRPATPTPPPPPTPDPGSEPLPAGVERIATSGHAMAVEAEGDSVWTGEWEVERIDAATGEVLATIEVDDFVLALDFDERAGLLWALVEMAETETSGVVAIDAATNEVVLDAVAVEPSNVSGQHFQADDGVAWVPGRGGVLTSAGLDGRVTTIDLSEHFAGSLNREGAFKVAVTEESVFVVATDGTIVRVDRATEAHEKVGELGWNTSDLVGDGRTLWLLQSGTKGGNFLWTLDGGTGEPLGEPVAVSRYGAVYAAEHAGTVWVVEDGGESTVVRGYRDGTGEPVTTLELPGSVFLSDVDAGASGLWLAPGEEFLYRVAPE